MHPLLHEFFNSPANKADAITIHCVTSEQRYALRELAARYYSDFSDKYLLMDPNECYGHTYYFWDTNMLQHGTGFNSFLYPNADSYECDEFMAIINGCCESDEVGTMEDIL